MKKIIILFIFSIAFTSFFLSNSYSINYENPKNLYNINILNTYEKDNNYFIQVEVNSYLKPLEFELEIFYPNENLFIQNKKFKCDGICQYEIELKKVFFGNYKINLYSTDNKINFKATTNFNLNLNQKLPKLNINSPIYINENKVNLKGNIEYSSNKEIEYTFEIYPLSETNLRQYFTKKCTNTCNFDFNLQAPYILDKYQLNVYSEIGEFYDFFNLDVKEEKSNIQKNTYKKDLSILKNNKIVNKINYLKEEKNEISTLQSFALMFSDPTIQITKTLLDGSQIIEYSKKSEINNYKQEYELQDITIYDGKTKEKIIRKTILKEKKLISNNDNNIYTLNNIKINSTKNQIKPGIYKEIDTSGNENYFTNGLVSINTKKPLYEKDSLVEFLIVVLDENGYPYSSSEINLYITKPTGEIILLSTQERSLFETEKNGVYSGYIYSEDIGKYELYANAKINDIYVEIDSYFNTLDFFEFDILRDVPATIDPWAGPFLNNFTIIPKINIDKFNLIEYIPKTFEIINSNANEFFEDTNSKILIWNDISENINPFYIANAPKITPYLYELGNAKIQYDNNFFIENRSWLFAIDPLIQDFSVGPVTCTDIWSASCGNVIDTDNTFDTCTNAAGTRAYVVEATLDKNASYGGADVQITCSFEPRSTRTEEYIYYFDGSIWSQIYSGNAPGRDLHDISVTQTLSTNTGTHWFRCIIDEDGEADECADIGSNFDNDDISIEVFSSFLNLLSPLNQSYLSSLVSTDIETSVLTNISYKIDSRPFNDVCSSCNSYSAFDIYTKGTHSIEVHATDISNGNKNIWIEYFTVLTDLVNPPRNTSMRTCTDTFGAFCGLWPADSEQDNTFDSCPTSIGGAADENVVEVYINTSTASLGSSVEIMCEFDPYDGGTEEYIYYFNTTDWTQLYSGNPIDGNVHNISVITTLSNVSGTHYFRCIVDWDGENDECADGGSYYDNDDVSIDVFEEIIFIPFILTVTSPENKTYDTNFIDNIFTTSKDARMEYSIDGEPYVIACTNCTSYADNVMYRDGVHIIDVRAQDLETSLWEYYSVTLSVSSNYSQPPRNTSMRTCTDTFGDFCGLWPATSEQDNTFDSCPNSIGGTTDEHVIEVYINMSSAYGGDSVEIMCEFDPYDGGTEEYMYYYDTNTWTQLYSGNPANGDIHNISVITTISNISGTHYFRCIADWDGENDECADGGTYFDNDDVSIDVTIPIIIPYELYILKPLNTTYNISTIELDTSVTKDSDIYYSIDFGTYQLACSNCTIYTQNFTFTNGQHNINILAMDLETLNNLTENISFSILVINESGENSSVNLQLTKNITNLGSNSFKINLELQNLLNIRTPVNKNIQLYTYIPNTTIVSSSFTYTNTPYYNLSITNETSIYKSYNGTLYKFEIIPTNIDNSSLNAYFGTKTNENSFNLVFNLTSLSNYYFQDLIYTSFYIQE